MKMTKVKLAILLGAAFFTANVNALSPDAEEGKELYPACNVCHDQALNPPKGPPMWGVQRRYKKHSVDDEVFVENIVNFVKAPSLDLAIHKQAVKQLGLMPPMPLPDVVLRKIATYILEENFSPPCDHWQIAITRAEKTGDMGHARKDRKMHNRFCSQN